MKRKVKDEDLSRKLSAEVLEAFKKVGIDEVKVIGDKIYILTQVNPNVAQEKEARRHVDETLQNAGYEYKKFRDSYSCSGERIGYGNIKKKRI